jgi:hypothetical protein
MREYPKRVKKQLKELAAKAYEAELCRELATLALRFDEWEAGETDPWELTDQIHQFHNGAARDLCKRYHSLHADTMVASAVAGGTLKRVDIPDEVWPHIEDLVEFWERELKTGGAAA